MRAETGLADCRERMELLTELLGGDVIIQSGLTAVQIHCTYIPDILKGMKIFLPVSGWMIACVREGMREG